MKHAFVPHSFLLLTKHPISMHSLQSTIIMAESICNCQELRYIFCRLGQFHTLMTFLGNIGNLMNSSRLAALLEKMYSEDSVKHRLSRAQVQRDLRVHFLIQSLLASHFFGTNYGKRCWSHTGERKNINLCKKEAKFVKDYKTVAPASRNLKENTELVCFIRAYEL